MSLKDDLVGVPHSDYGELHQEHLLEIYKLYVEMADRISQRRQLANSFFLSLNTAIAALVGYVQLGVREDASPVFYATVSGAGIAISYLWYRLVRSYKDLNSGKFKVVHEIEAMLPIKPYDAEWTALGQGKRPDLYLPFTHVETLIPWVFLVVHAIVFLRLVPWAAVWNVVGALLPD